MPFKLGAAGAGGDSPDLQLDVMVAAANNPSSTKWRLLCHTPQNGGANISVAEIEMHTAYGGTDICTGGTVNASYDNGSFPKGNAFDNNPATFWWTDANEQWIEYQFASPVAVVEMSISARNDGFYNDSPKSFEIQYYNGSTYVTVANLTNQVWTNGQTKTYQFGNYEYNGTLTVAGSVDVTNWRAALNLASDGSILDLVDFTGSNFTLSTSTNSPGFVTVYPANLADYGSVTPAAYGPATPS
jgi:hypothetical protein